MQVTLPEITTAGVKVTTDEVLGTPMFGVDHGPVMLSFHPTARFAYVFDVVKVEDKSTDHGRYIVLWHKDGTFTSVRIIE